jgi:hypothetical protein
MHVLNKNEKDNYNYDNRMDVDERFVTRKWLYLNIS